MAFDAAMVSAIVAELNEKILDARVEKVNQPDKDEIILNLHVGRQNLRLSISSGTNNPHFGITNETKENPLVAPMFCMLLRKHLTGAKLVSVTQLGFERAVEFGFDGYDEMGFKSMKYLVTETMGKYSNVILLSAEKKVVSAIKLIDLASSSVRQILPGFPYELPPEQKKLNPLTASREQIEAAILSAGDSPSDKAITSKFYGLAAVTAREVACRASGRADTPASECAERLADAIVELRDNMLAGRYEPWLVSDKAGKPLEYLFFEPLEYGEDFEVRRLDSFGTLLDEYFGRRDKAERIRQRTSDIFRLLSNAEARLTKKIALQREDLAACADKESYKLMGDLITANIWRLERGMEKCELENYYSENCEKITIELDKRLSPQANAQRWFKKYSKAKTAEVELAKQIKIAEGELEYINTVFDSLTRAESESDILEIRDELYRSGYASRMKSYAAKKLAQPKLMEFRTTDGAKVLVGKNNHQNDQLSTKLASKSDYWFHVKDRPGSHAVLFVDTVASEDGEPTDRDFTEAAEIAAYHSSDREGVSVPVDYTLAKNLRKPSGSKPGFVTYSTNYTAYVTPSERRVLALRVK